MYLQSEHLCISISYHIPIAGQSEGGHDADIAAMLQAQQDATTPSHKDSSTTDVKPPLSSSTQLSNETSGNGGPILPVHPAQVSGNGSYMAGGMATGMEQHNIIGGQFVSTTHPHQALQFIHSQQVEIGNKSTCDQ